MSNNTIHDVITVTIGGGEWTLRRYGENQYGFPPALAGITFGRAFIDAARRAMRGPATPITIDGARAILTSVEVIATVPGPRMFALAWEPVSRLPPVNVAIAIDGDGEPWTPAKVLRHVREEMPEVQAVLDRCAREAPLVALVAAVPEGLDPVGWRAAVLTYAENYRAPWWRADEVAKLVDELALTIQGRTRHDGDSAVSAAYRRATAPQGPRPAPFRRKSPGLPLDMGDG